MKDIISLLILGFALSQDNFRVSIAVGTFKHTWRRALRIALVFGLWDGIAPLVGLLIGDLLGKAIGPVADIIGPIVLAGYGIYLLVRVVVVKRAEGEEEEPDDRIVLFGLPLPLSLDNMIAGTGLGLVGFPPIYSAVFLGVMTFVWSLVGLQLGKVIARFIRVRYELLAGLGLLLVAALLAFGIGSMGGDEAQVVRSFLS
ncbi:hypothetical protein KSF_086330 [Reticulibacter mediterranei]|uniref:Mn2+ efflux pump MntP n=1 Tax=Reticulibacter mediterranei TaxID=2778369 RepID=A0A8J3IU62_9CHLR|nr:manganese efflux pump [Reticulibacter mediterranei]GHO98585.1 hypothetical protein KSF_086330 [Reticulibacter mediterranei]